MEELSILLSSTTEGAKMVEEIGKVESASSNILEVLDEGKPTGRFFHRKHSYRLWWDNPPPLPDKYRGFEDISEWRATFIDFYKCKCGRTVIGRTEGMI